MCSAAGSAWALLRIKSFPTGKLITQADEHPPWEMGKEFEP